MYARAVIPEAEAGSAYLVYALQLLPDGVRGFVLAGILATILSTLDSYLFLAGTTLSYDLAPAKHKGKTALHAFGIVFVAALAVALAMVFDGNIKSVWKTLGSYSASCLLLPVLYGYIFPGRIKDSQFVFGCLMGVVGTTYWRNFRPDGFLSDVDELYFGGVVHNGRITELQFFCEESARFRNCGMTLLDLIFHDAEAIEWFGLRIDQLL